MRLVSVRGVRRMMKPWSERGADTVIVLGLMGESFKDKRSVYFFDVDGVRG